MMNPRPESPVQSAPRNFTLSALDSLRQKLTSVHLKIGAKRLKRLSFNPSTKVYLVLDTKQKSLPFLQPQGPEKHLTTP